MVVLWVNFLLNVKTYKVSPYFNFKALDKVKNTVETKAFYLNPVPNGILGTRF